MRQMSHLPVWRLDTGLDWGWLDWCVVKSAAVAMISSKEADMLRSLEALRYATVTKAGHDQTYLFNDSPLAGIAAVLRPSLPRIRRTLLSIYTTILRHKKQVLVV